MGIAARRMAPLLLSLGWLLAVAPGAAEVVPLSPDVRLLQPAQRTRVVETLDPYRVPCGDGDGVPVQIDLENGFLMETDRDAFYAVRDALGADGIEYTQEGRLRLARRIAQVVPGFGAGSLVEAGVLVQEVRPLPCYDQKVTVVYERVLFETGVEYLDFNLRPTQKPIRWEWHRGYALRTRARYVEEERCSAACPITDKTGPVLGTDGAPLWAMVRSDPVEYLVPLYWRSDGCLIDVLGLLPAGVHTNP